MENRDLARCKQKTGTVRTADTGLHLGARLSEVGNLDFRARGEAKNRGKPTARSNQWLIMRSQLCQTQPHMVFSRAFTLFLATH